MRGGRIIAAILAVSGLCPIAGADSISARQQEVMRAEQTQIAVSAAAGRDVDPAMAASMIGTLKPKNDPSVRRASAYGLRKALGSRFRSGNHMRRQIVSALQQAAKSDPSASVRRVARESLAFGNSHGPAVAMNENATGFVTVSGLLDPSDGLSVSAQHDADVALRQALKKHAPTMQVAAGDKMELPTAADLSRAHISGYLVGGTVSKMAVATRGNRVVVECAISLRVSPWEGRDGGERLRAGEAASASGKGRVDGGTADLEMAKSECIRSVVTEVATRQLVPFLNRKK